MWKRISWKTVDSDAEALACLKALPRYHNTPLKSLYRRGLFFLHLLYCKILGLKRPLFVVLVTNNDCNLDCTYCYGEYGKRSAKNNYSTLKLLQIIDELKSLGCRLLTLHGGESLLRKDIGEIINYCKLNGFYVSLNTNGYLVPKRVHEIAAVDTIIFSLDGSKKSNDANRGDGCYDRVIQAIDTSLAKGIPTVISATLTAHNQAREEMDFLAQLAKEKGIRVQYSLLYNEEKLAAKEEATGLLPGEGLRASIEHIKRLKHQGFPVYYADSVLDAAIRWEDLAGGRRTVAKQELGQVKANQMIPCYHGSLKFQIDADGRVVRCWAWDKVDAPNIKTLGLKNALSACGADDACRHCAFLANNEHNAMLDLSPVNLFHVASIQIADAFKVGRRRSTSPVVSELVTPLQQTNFKPQHEIGKMDQL